MDLQKSDIKYRLEHNPAYACLIMDLQPNQKVVVEAGGMAAMDPSISMKSNMRGGFGKSFGRMLSGESLFLSEFTANHLGGELYISPGVPGDIKHYRLEAGGGLVIQSSGFVASGEHVDLDTKFQGFKGFVSGESLFLMKATGQGDLWCSFYGAIFELDV